MNIEKYLRTFANQCYVIGVYDCCREVADDEKLMRGVGVAASRDFEDPLGLTIELAPVKAKLRYVHIAGTAPSQMVDANSKLARTFFGHFEMSARGNGGSTIKIPEDIRSFTGHDGKVEPLLLGDPTVLDWGKV